MSKLDPNYETLVADERRTSAELMAAAQRRRTIMLGGNDAPDLTPAGHYLGAARERIEQPDVWRCAPLLLAACRAHCALISQ